MLQLHSDTPAHTDACVMSSPCLVISHQVGQQVQAALDNGTVSGNIRLKTNVAK